MAMTYSGRRGLPLQVRFVATSVAGVTLLGPDQEIAKTDPVPVQVGSTDVYTCVVTPDEWGTWLLVTDDGAGNVTSTTEIECRPAIDTESTYEALVPVWPTGILGAAPSAFAPRTGTTCSFVSAVKMVVPLDCMIWGCSVYAAADTDHGHVTSLRFFTASGTTAGQVRGISEDLLDRTPDSGTWGTEGWIQVRFAKPVKARAGDVFGLEVTGASADHVGVQPLEATHTSAVILARDGALDLAGPVTFAACVAAPCALAIKPLITPPDVVVAGHSIMAGHGASAESPNSSLYEIDDRSLKDYDPARVLQRMTGLSCINVADGGTGLSLWLGGLFASNVTPLRPRRVLYDTLCNESSIANVMTRLPILLAMCDAIEAELVVCEAPPVENFELAGDATAEAFNVSRCAVEQWCALNGVRYLPALYALGEHSGGTEPAIRRNQPKGVRAGSEFLAYGLTTYSSTDGTHLKEAGYRAMVAAWVRGLAGERTANKPAMTAAAILGSKASVSGDTVTFYSADNTTELAKTTVDGGTRGQRTVAVIP